LHHSVEALAPSNIGLFLDATTTTDPLGRTASIKLP
jgi:hypothetical protein